MPSTSGRYGRPRAWGWAAGRELSHVGEGTAWVIDAASGEVLRVDPVTGSIAAHIAVGNGPTGIAAGGGSIWVTNQDDRSVSRIDPATNTVSQRIIVGNAPTGIAVGEGAVWVVNSLDDTVVRLDLGSGARQGTPIGVGERPAGIAVGLGSVWVTDEATGRVSRISPTSDQVIETIPVGRGPVGITVGDTAVWVANRVDSTVSRIDPVTGSVTTSDIGADPATLVADGDDVWVADEAGGRLLRIDPTTHIVASIVDLGNPPRALGIDGRTLYTTTRSPAAAHRGGTLVVVSSRTVDDMDPAISGWTNPDSLMAATYYLTGDTLVAYRHVGGSAGTTLVPDLAQSVPDPADAGRSYTFRIQPGLTFSDGTPVSPSDVRRTFERAYTVSEGLASGLGPPTLTGVERCSPDGCDLSEGIVTDATAGTVTFRLTAPDPDFLYRVANPLFTIVPASTPDPFIAGPGGSQVLGVGGPIPGTGPYRVAQVDVGHQRIVLERNPRFHVWSSDARPDGYPDSIELDGGLDPFDQVAMIDGATPMPSTGPSRTRTWPPGSRPRSSTTSSSRPRSTCS